MCYIDVLQSGTRSQEAPTDQHGNVGQGTCEISHWNPFTESLLPYFGDQLSQDTCTCHHFFTSSNPPNLRGDSHCWLRAEWSFWIMFYECMNPWEPHMWTKWKNFDVVRFVWTLFRCDRSWKELHGQVRSTSRASQKRPFTDDHGRHHSMRKEYRNVALELRGFVELFENGAAVFLTFVNAWNTCEWIALMFGFRLSIGQAKDGADPKESNQEALFSILLVGTCLHLWRTACSFVVDFDPENFRCWFLKCRARSFLMKMQLWNRWCQRLLMRKRLLRSKRWYQKRRASLRFCKMKRRLG